MDRRALAKHVRNAGLHETVDQHRGRLERETKLRRKIEAWMAVQVLFIPEVALLRDMEEAARKRTVATQPVPGVKAKDVKLWLPSAIGMHTKCNVALQDYEYKLRKGQAVRGLEEMRNGLLVRTHEFQYRDGIAGVRAKTRSGARTTAIQRGIDTAAEDYRAAYGALRKLGPLLQRDEWKAGLQVLKAEDKWKRRKRAHETDAEAAERARRRAEERMEMLWIWKVQASTERLESVVVNEALHVKWAKTWAKAMRYAEEVDLLEEEMRRVLAFLCWRAGRWRLRATLQEEDVALREGHEVYAHKQAGYMDRLQDKFEAQWAGVVALLEDTWKKYAAMLPDEKEEGADSGWLSD
ncbi:hypothetical protein K438DRAFT_1980572 [Mycena galopus ATCC 62051]|nr:hypothetical protein K438DRAFT_1980572 [Mycena galopus ATCC 62051]